MPDLDLVVEQLCAPSSLETVLHHPLHDSPMPSLEELGEIMSRLKATLFPGYFGVSCVHVESMRYHLSANLDSIFRKLAEQIRRGGCFACASYATDCMSCEEVSMRKAMEFMQRLPTSAGCWRPTPRRPMRAIPPRPAPGKPFSVTPRCSP